MGSKVKQAVYWSLLQFEDWNFYLASTDKGLCYVGSLNQPFKELAEWAKKYFPGSPLIEEHQTLEPFVAEFMEYFAGTRKTFTILTDFRGTPFQVAVWNALCKIPYGETKTYSDIACFIDKPTAVRAVGAAIGANPVLITVPCHRVIGKNGALTGFRGGLEMKVQLLELEKQHSFIGPYALK